MSAATNSAQRATSEALNAIGTLFRPGDVIEIRALDVGQTSDGTGSTHAGYFNFENSTAIASAIGRLDGKAEGVYVVFNRVNPDLLARSNNRLTTRPKRTTGDADIIEWRWLFIDADAVRPSGISATDAEHEAAVQRTLAIREFLAEGGWPEPILADSGNGSHLLFRLPRLDLEHAGDLVKRCLKALSTRFSDSVVIVDESTANAARMCKLYGTLARKGDSTQERPHRRSALLDVPERIEPVALEALEALASEGVAAAPARQNIKIGTGSDGRFDIDQWLSQSGLDIIKGPEGYGSGRKWTLRTCSFNAEHAKPVVIQLGSGALVYKCLHKSCEGNDWKAFRARIDPTLSLALTSKSGTPGLSRLVDTPPNGITDLSQLPSVWSMPTKLDWCVEGMIACGSVTLICAESGVGKTWLGYYIAGRIAHGAPVLGREVHRSKVLYLDGENPLYTVKERLEALGIDEIEDLIVWGGWNISPPEGPQSLLVIEFARQHKPVLIFDSLIEFHPGSEQSSTETRAFMRYFRALANLGATVIVLHHTGKADTAKLYRGSSDIKAAVDTAYLLQNVGDESNRLGKLSLKCFKGRLAPGQNFGFEFQEGSGFIACDLPLQTKTVESVIDDILEAHPRINQKEIVRLGRERGCSKRQLEHSLRNGCWHEENGPNNSILYSPPGPSDFDRKKEK